MFGIFTKESTSEYKHILLDPHVTSPGQDETVIVRNSRNAAAAVLQSDIYKRARTIYSRGRRSSLRRSAGII